MSSGNDLAHYWMLDRSVTFLNHGSFGACPIPVLEAQSRLRNRLESEPVTFLVNDLEALLDEARRKLAAFVGADPSDLAFVPNATTGFNAVLRSLRLSPGDELLTTDHAYNAARNALEYVAAQSGARVVVAALPFPVKNEAELIEAILRGVSSRTRLALLDHITSPTALILPVRALVSELDRRGIDTLVDAAHAPGMIPLDLGSIGAAYYTGNCHKWLSAPKGAAFLHVRKDRQNLVRPTTISHGANSPRKDRSRYLLEFDWPGTYDPTPYLSIPAAIEFIGSLQPGGWDEVMRRNHTLALQARDLLCHHLGIEPPAPDEMLGSMATIPLPDGAGDVVVSPLDSDPLHYELFERFRIEIPVWPWPHSPKRILRLSAYLYNSIDDYKKLAQALETLLSMKLRAG